MLIQHLNNKGKNGYSNNKITSGWNKGPERCLTWEEHLLLRLTT